jgi:predicted phosphodiesterase
MDKKEDVLQSIVSVIQFCTEEKIPFTRDAFRKIAKNHGLACTSDSTARKLFGSWDDAVKAAVASIPSIDKIVDEPLNLESDFSYLKRKWVGHNTYKVLVLPDIHVPFQNKKALNAAIRLGEEFGPDEVIQLGDLLDCYKISRFTKNPERGVKLQEEIDQATEILNSLKSRTGARKATFIQGNHESRIKKYLEANAPSLAHLKSLKIESMLNLKDIGWDFIPEHYFYAINKVYFTHGEFVSPQSSDKHMRTYSETIVHGHTHKLQHHCLKHMNKTIEGWEMGCLASFAVSQDYQKMANWQHGVGTITIVGENYWIQGHHIRDGKVHFNNKLIEG